MNRRTALASLAGVGTTLLAGCSSPLENRLRHEVVDDGEGEVYVEFTSGGSQVASMGYLLGHVVDGRMRFRTSLSQGLDGIRNFRLRFSPTTSSEGALPRVLLERPGGYPFPAYRFQSDGEYGWTRFEVPDLEAQAPGTFVVEFWFDGVDPTERLAVTTDLRAELDAGFGRGTAVAEAVTTVRGPDPGR